MEILFDLELELGVTAHYDLGGLYIDGNDMSKLD